MIRQFTALSVLSLLAGCASQLTSIQPSVDTSRNPELVSPDLYAAESAATSDPTVRYSRYTLVNTLPDEGQRDLMSQIIDVSMPANMNPSVRDAMDYVTARSGYGLCAPETGYVGILYSRPLPSAQYKLGPMSLRNTLQVLAGPAWQVKVDEVSRNVCFNLRAGYKIPALPPVAKPTFSSKPSISTSPDLAATTAQPIAVPAVTVTPIVTSPTTTHSASPVPSAPVDQAKDGRPTSPGTSVTGPSAGATVPAITAASTPEPKPAVVVAASANTSTVPPTSIPAATKPAKSSWKVSIEDQNIRHTIGKWAPQAGWTFDEREHWVSDVDIPISANATFEGDIKDAVSGLVGTTELTDTPLQPCFYSNQVIRVVSYNVTCDPASVR